MDMNVCVHVCAYAYVHYVYAFAILCALTFDDGVVFDD